MKKPLIVLTLCGVLNGPAMLAEVNAQEFKHVEPNEEKTVPAKKADGMKCCESMDKMGEMKGVMPTKGEMTREMKAKMDSMKEMKEKMAEKMGENGMKMQTKESMVEKNPTSKDAHQH